MRLVAKVEPSPEIDWAAKAPSLRTDEERRAAPPVDDRRPEAEIHVDPRGIVGAVDAVGPDIVGTGCAPVETPRTAVGVVDIEIGLQSVVVGHHRDRRSVVGDRHAVRGAPRLVAVVAPGASPALPGQVGRDIFLDVPAHVDRVGDRVDRGVARGVGEGSGIAHGVGAAQQVRGARPLVAVGARAEDHRFPALPIVALGGGAELGPAIPQGDGAHLDVAALPAPELRRFSNAQAGVDAPLQRAEGGGRPRRQAPQGPSLGRPRAGLESIHRARRIRIQTDQKQRTSGTRHKTIHALPPFDHLERDSERAPTGRITAFPYLGGRLNFASSICRR